MEVVCGVLTNLEQLGKVINFSLNFCKKEALKVNAHTPHVQYLRHSNLIVVIYDSPRNHYEQFSIYHQNFCDLDSCTQLMTY